MNDLQQKLRQLSSLPVEEYLVSVEQYKQAENRQSPVLCVRNFSFIHPGMGYHMRSIIHTNRSTDIAYLLDPSTGDVISNCNSEGQLIVDRTNVKKKSFNESILSSSMGFDMLIDKNQVKIVNRREAEYNMSIRQLTVVANITCGKNSLFLKMNSMSAESWDMYTLTGGHVDADYCMYHMSARDYLRLSLLKELNEEITWKKEWDVYVPNYPRWIFTTVKNPAYATHMMIVYDVNIPASEIKLFMEIKSMEPNHEVIKLPHTGDNFVNALANQQMLRIMYQS